MLTISLNPDDLTKNSKIFKHNNHKEKFIIVKIKAAGTVCQNLLCELILAQNFPNNPHNGK